MTQKPTMPRAARLRALAPLIAAATVAAGMLAGPPTSATQFANSLPTGTVITPAGVRVETPEGKSFGLLPQAIALSPSGGLLATSDPGNDTKTVTIVDLAANQVAANFKVVYQGHEMASFAGIAWQDNDTLWLSGGSYNAVYQLTRKPDGTFGVARVVPVGSFPAQIAFDSARKRLYVANDMSNSLTVIDTQTGAPIQTVPAGDHPYGLLATSSRVYVSNWGNSTVSAFTVTDAGLVPEGASPNPGGTTDYTTIVPGAPTAAGAVAAVGRHPTAMALSEDGATLYVTNGNDDTVSVVNTATMTQASVVKVSPTLADMSPRSASPGALAMTGDYLFVALGGDNAIAVVDRALAATNPSIALIGYIPAGWYPSALQIVGGDLYYANAKGDGPTGGSGGGTGALFQGRGVPPLGSMWHLPVTDAISDLNTYTAQVIQNNRWDTLPGAVSASGTPLTHIKHVVYILRENKTYDEEFSDIAAGDGQPCQTVGATATWNATNQNYTCSDTKSPLLLYGREITPNNHALAEQYALLDNFSVDVETSIIGHQWANASQLSDFAQRTYGNTSQWTSQEPGFFPQNGAFDIADTGEGYLFSAIARRSHSVRAYSGAFDASDVSARPENLESILEDDDMLVPIGLDSGIYPDTLRVKEFERDVEQRGLADFSFIWLADDHTVGGLPGNLTPQSQVATNDIATGQLVDYVSHSDYWKDTAIFVIEDDPQSGRDHVSGYRSIFMLASPWAKRSYQTAQHYDMSAMLRTMELIFDVPPLSHNDLTIAPMIDLFTDQPDYTSYTWLTPQVPPTLNPPDGPFVAETRAFNLGKADPPGFDRLVAKMAAAGDYGWWFMRGARSTSIAKQWARAIAAGTNYASLFEPRHR